MPERAISISIASVAWRSMRYFFKTHLALVLGIAAATAVLVGALVVGDSVRGSMRRLVLDRLANVECLLHSRVFLSSETLTSLSAPENAAVEPAIVLAGSTVEFRSDGNLQRASSVQVLALQPSLWSGLESESDLSPLQPDEVALNISLAKELGVAVGDEITIRVNDAVGVSGDNPLGRRDDTSVNIPRQTVAMLLPDEGFGGIRFVSSQSVARNAFLSLETVQDLLELPAQVNAALVLNKSPSIPLDGQAVCDELNLSLRPKIGDYGLQLTRHRRVFPDAEIDTPENPDAEQSVVFDYYQVSSKELLLDDKTREIIVERVGPDSTMRIVTYLINSMSKIEPDESDLSPDRSAAAFPIPRRNLAPPPKDGRPFLVTNNDMGYRPPVAPERPFVPPQSRIVPYSIVVGLDFDSTISFRDYVQVELRTLQAPYCFVNSWLAEQMDVAAGDWIQASFFEPETVEGREVQRTTRMMIAGVVPITEPVRRFTPRKPASFAQAPTIFNDPDLTPSVPGVTDQESISQWDLPFKLDLKIPPVDDQYWNNHRLTPKIFMPYHLASSDELFGSRFGHATAVRIPAEKVQDEDQLRKEIEEALLDTRAEKGITFLPLRERQLQAASGTTPFDVLFLSLSFFVIVAALLLVFLLFRLGIQQRHSEIGLLAAQGFTPNRIRRLLLSEFAWLSLIGAVVGILLGLGYARLIVAGLESWWIGAISARFLHFSATAQSIAIGATAGCIASLVAIYFGMRSLASLSPLQVLRGQASNQPALPQSANRVHLALAGFFAFGAIGLVIAGTGMAGMARAGCFFGSGMLLLAAVLFGVGQLIRIGVKATHSPDAASTTKLAWKTICRNPMRSSLTLSLLAVATFLIASMGVFQVSPTERGYGGFNLMATSSQPVYRNIGSKAVQIDQLGEEAAMRLGDTSILSLRTRQGEDASCNNLFQVQQPTILGITPRLSQLQELSPQSVEFDWAAAKSPSNPWLDLEEPADGTEKDPIPVILDQNTAAWSLKQGAAIDGLIRIEMEDRVLYFKTVGLLFNSVFQGKLLIGQLNFEETFPKVSGYSTFLIRTAKGRTPDSIAQILETGWSNEGLDVTYSKDTLAAFLGVQNTYISAFQSLGALGLLLGTFGLVAVQLRSVLERQREFALMRAVGFAPGSIQQLLSLETVLLLVGGLLIGALCAAVAVVPYVIQVGPELSLLSPLMMLAGVLIAGFVAARIAVRNATKGNVVAGLRSQ